MDYSSEHSQAIRALIDVDYEAVIALLSKSLIQHYRHRLIAIAEFPQPLSTYDLGIQCIPDEEFSAREDVGREPLLFTEAAAKLVKQALREVKAKPTKLRVWMRIEEHLRREDDELFKPLPLTHFDENVLLSKASREATVKLGRVPFDPSALGEMAPVVPSTVPVDTVPDYDEARQELRPVDKLFSNDLKFKDGIEQKTVIDLVLHVTSCIRSVKPLELDTLLGPDGVCETVEPNVMRPISPPLVAARTGKDSSDSAGCSSTSIMMLVAGLMEVPFGHKRRDAAALAYSSRNESQGDIDLEDFQEWESSESLDCPSAEVMASLSDTEDEQDDSAARPFCGSIDGLQLAQVRRRSQDLYLSGEEETVWFGADAPLFPRLHQRATRNFQGGIPTAYTSFLHDHLLRRPPLNLDQANLDLTLLPLIPSDKDTRRVCSLIAAESLDCSFSSILMLPVPSLPRTRAVDSPSPSSLLLTTKALVGREPPDGTLARRTGLLKPLSGLKSLNIELSDVWSANASKDITFLSEQPDCTDEASALVEQIPVDSPVTVRDMVRGFVKSDEDAVSCTAPLQQGIASDTPSPVLETKWMPDRPPARPERNEGAEAEYDLEGDRVLQEPTVAEVNPGYEARKVSPLRHGSGGRDDSQQGLSIDDMNRQEEREACQVVSRFGGDLDCESLDARPLLFDNDGFPLHFLDYRDEEDVEDSHSLSSILPQWATERRGWMDYVVDEDEEQIAMRGVTSLEDTGEGRPIPASTQAQIRDPPVTQRPTPALQTETSAQIPCPVRSQAQYFRYPRSSSNKSEDPDWQETRKRQAVDIIAAEDGKLMAVVKRVRSERVAAHRSRLSPIDMYLRMTGKEVPSSTGEMPSNPGAMRPIEISPPQQEKLDELEHSAEEDSSSDPAASPAEGYLAPSHTHHYLVSLRGLQNHRVMSYLTGRCNVTLIEATGVQDDWEWDLILDATSAVILFKLSLLPAAMKVEDRTTGAGSKALASGSEGDLTLKQMLQSERFDSFLVVLEAYSSSGRQVGQTRPLLLAQDALKEYTSRHLGSNKRVTIDVVRSPFEAAIRIRRWGDELQENAAREDEALLRQGTPTSGVMLTPAKIWEGRERWLSEAASEKGERERSRLQTLGLNIFASTIVLAVRTSLSTFLNDPPERRRDDFASVLGRPRMNKLNARLKREEGLRRPDGEGA